MKIGPYNIEEGAMLAPMAGISNPPFRLLCHEMGASLAVTELISAHALVYLETTKKKEKRLAQETIELLESYPAEHPFAVQIFGRDPEQMAHAAQIAESKGAHIIDLNFGCPARKVIKAGEGAGVALMRTPDLLISIAQKVVDAVKVPVTAKTRTGWSNSERNAVQISKRLEDVGVQAICVHGRTRDQVHGGPVDLETIKEVVEAVKIPVVGNGGIHTAEDAKLMIEKTGCARVAVGQGARGNPWIFSAIKHGSPPPTLKERIAVCRRHLELYIAYCGEYRAVREMRKHATWYLKGFNGAAAFRKNISEAVSTEAFHALLDRID